MTSTLFDRRRAERFARLLEEPAGSDGTGTAGTGPRSHLGHRHRVGGNLEGELAPLVALTGRVAELPQAPAPDPEFREGLRAMLIATAERDGIGSAGRPEPDSRSAKRVKRTRITLVVGVAAGALAVSGVSAASGDAKPGDPLYQVKRSTERAQLALAGSDSSRGELYLEFARVRLHEASRVSPGLLPQVLLDMDTETRQGVRLLATAAVGGRDARTLDTIDQLLDGQREGVRDLIESLPAAGQERARQSLQLINAASVRVDALRAAMACGAPSTTLDELGPVPVACPRSNAPRPEASDPATPRPSHSATAGSGPSAPAGGTQPAPSTSPSPTTGSGDLLDGVGHLISDLVD